jgi:microtubule-associated protein, RP/EB family
MVIFLLFEHFQMNDSANVVTENLSQHEMLSWVNDCLQLSYTGVEEMCTGEAYCLLMQKLFPGSILLEKVKFGTNLEHEYIQNFKILQGSLKKKNVVKVMYFCHLKCPDL